VILAVNAVAQVVTAATLLMPARIIAKQCAVECLCSTAGAAWRHAGECAPIELESRNYLYMYQ
jgi:hypothetical protein